MRVDLAIAVSMGETTKHRPSSSDSALADGDRLRKYDGASVSSLRRPMCPARVRVRAEISRRTSQVFRPRSKAQGLYSVSQARLVRLAMDRVHSASRSDLSLSSGEAGNFRVQQCRARSCDFPRRYQPRRSCPRNPRSHRQRHSCRQNLRSLRRNPRSLRRNLRSPLSLLHLRLLPRRQLRQRPRLRVRPLLRHWVRPRPVRPRPARRWSARCRNLEG